jgi:hypothetical protein
VVNDSADGFERLYMVKCGDKSSSLEMHNEILLKVIRAPRLDWRDNTDPNVCRDRDVNFPSPG